jgi:Phage gp6-like head-tail connector protein
MTILELLKTYLNIPPADTSKDAELNQYIDIARSYIDEYLGRVTLLTSHTDIFQGEVLSALILRHWPIFSVVSITSKGVAETLADYKVYNELGKIIKWQDYIQQKIEAQYIEVAYSAGWGAGQEPLWLVDAIALTSANLYSQKGTGAVSVATGAISSETVNGIYSVTYDTSVRQASNAEGFSQIPSKARAILDMNKMRYT